MLSRREVSRRATAPVSPFYRPAAVLRTARAHHFDDDYRRFAIGISCSSCDDFGFADTETRLMHRYTCIAWSALFVSAAAVQAQQALQVAEPALRLELLERATKDEEARGALITWQKEHGPLSGTFKL